jgi:hypothetical protein
MALHRRVYTGTSLSINNLSTSRTSPYSTIPFLHHFPTLPTQNPQTSIITSPHPSWILPTIIVFGWRTGCIVHRTSMFGLQLEFTVLCLQPHLIQT